MDLDFGGSGRQQTMRTTVSAPCSTLNSPIDLGATETTGNPVQAFLGTKRVKSENAWAKISF